MKYNERIREIREDNYLTRQKIADLLILAKFYDVLLDYITGASDIPKQYPKE